MAPRLHNGKFEGEFVVQKGEDAAHLRQSLEMWQQLLAQQTPAGEAPITVTLPDGKEMQATAATTPLEIATMISPKLAESVVVAKVLRVDQARGGDSAQQGEIQCLRAQDLTETKVAASTRSGYFTSLSAGTGLVPDLVRR